MALRLSSPVIEIPRVGPAKAGFLKKIGIQYVRDILYTFPRRHDDFSLVTPIDQLKVGQKMTVRGTVSTVKSQWGWQGRRRLLRIFVDIKDDTGVLHVTWYNLRFLPKQLWKDRPILVAGTVELFKKDQLERGFAMRSPVLEFPETVSEPTHTSRITPVYPETYGVSSRWLRYQVKQLLPLVQALPEYIPQDIRQRHTLMGIHEALREVHFPSSTAQLGEAQRRLRFDELFFLQLAALVRRQVLKQAAAIAISVTKKQMTRDIKKLPFTLTKAQKSALDEIVADLGHPVPMNRLLQGDVGSGKSAVALLATQQVLAAGYKVLYLAPTEILARQQAGLFGRTLGDDQVALLIGALTAPDKARLKQKLLATGPLCVVGTHALIQDTVQATDVALAIVDEQHRFGVDQRQALQGVQLHTVPHLLSMTATPIPRTLTLTVYGDLDVSVLNELPPGRKPIKTEVVSPHDHDRVVVHILEELHKGRQAYVIAPLVQESETLAAKSAVKAAREMTAWLPNIAVGLVHGQMKSIEKESVMRHFVAGAIQVLVATAVIEVGVNVPNATIMIIEGAERFGLAQLHQFRGRIGRGIDQAYCYVFATTAEAMGSARLHILAQTTDGFKIAEEDLKLRGPGEIYGVSQSGFGDLKVASLLDYATIKEARTEAARLLQRDPALARYPILRKKVEQKNMQTHFE